MDCLIHFLAKLLQYFSLKYKLSDKPELVIPEVAAP